MLLKYQPIFTLLAWRFRRVLIVFPDLPLEMGLDKEEFILDFGIPCGLIGRTGTGLKPDSHLRQKTSRDLGFISA
jgi:hypothetical protein